MRPILFALLTAYGFTPLCAQEDIPTLIRGVYAHPGPIWEKNLRLDELSINAVFVRRYNVVVPLLSTQIEWTL